MSARVLVTGGQGFIGRAVAAHWLSSDPQAHVVALGRSPRRDDRFPHAVHWGERPVPAPVPEAARRAMDPERYRYERLDLNDQPGLVRLIRSYQPTIVVHVAGALRDDRLSDLVTTNILGTSTLLEAIAGSGWRPEAVVLGSSGGVYGAVGALPVSETDACLPIDQYSATKLAAEQVGCIAAARHGVRLVRARIFNAVGPGQDERHVTSWLAMQAASIGAGLRPPVLHHGPLATTRDFIPVEEVARALSLLALRGEAGAVYNVASGRETRIEDVRDLVLATTGLRGRVAFRLSPARPADIPRQVASIARLRDLGFEPGIEMPEAIGSLVRYYRDEVSGAASRNGTPIDTPLQAPRQVSIAVRYHYPIEIRAGLVERIPERLDAQFRDARVFVLTDTRVRGLLGTAVADRIRQSGRDVGLHALPPGETSKSLPCFQETIEAMHRFGFDRRSVLLNLGGGLVSDVGGYVAASYLRGVAYVNVPTTLLAQHDAAVGGKVAVNMPWGKNFVGAFHHPRAVWIDPAVLQTLDAADLSSGVAEAIKVALCGSVRLFHVLESGVAAILERRAPAVLEEVVRLAIDTKLAILDPDPHEADLRRSLNLGHTFGHPLETELAYRDLRHGEAVGFGLAVATAIARRRDVCDEETAERIYALLHAYGLPPRVPRSQLLSACRRLETVQLVRGGALHFVLPATLGTVEISDEVTSADVREAIDHLSRHPLLGRSVSEA
ncbi:MAG TPA: iron-containing alcohol dehydrogenase [Candidatus Polarisedimenticolia bacterium]|nr:iron-containing alcohol dehydrogenase [Candidatus Polarisedimenticolia bacterium]